MSPNNNIKAFILAGGKSSRMGSEKGLVKINGRPFVEHIIDCLKQTDLPIEIISNSDHYNYLNLPTHADLIKERGPLGGIYTALHNSNREYNFILSCDIPFISNELLKHLQENIDSTYDCIIPTHNGKTEPLCGIYKKSMSEKCLQLLKDEQLSVINALTQFKVKYIEISNRPYYNNKLLQNINTPQELDRSLLYN